MSAHTPGPLETVGGLVRTAITPERPEGWLVADCYTGVALPPEQVDANARLFAAAPDMAQRIAALEAENAGLRTSLTIACDERDMQADVVRWLREELERMRAPCVPGEGF